MRKLLSSKFRSSSQSSSERRPDGSSDDPSPGPSSATEESGLLPLWVPDKDEPLVDIVAVHGLSGHPRKTWTADSGHLWLKDFLPGELPYSRIFSFGYDSQLAFSQSAASIRDFSIGLLDELDNARARPEEKNRPLLFVGHSLGGIVIKKALILALEQQHRYGDILHCTKGILFLGTPHKGAQLANWTRYARDIIEIAPLGPSIVRKRLLQDLETNSRSLAEISDSFQHRALKIKIASFYERVYTSPMKRLVVDENSAVLGFPGEEALPIDADHREICKVRTTNSQQWRTLVGALKRQLADLDLDAKLTEVQEARAKVLEKPAPEILEKPSPEVRGKPAPEVVERINSLFDPVQFDDEVEQRVGFEMCPDTASWVLTNPNYTNWRDDKKCGLLWIHGNPGSGKSFLTSFILRNLLDGALTGHSGVAYFACDRSERPKPRSHAVPLYSSILSQLLLQLFPCDPDSAERILVDIEACQAVGQLDTPFRQWKNLQLTTSAFKSCFVIVDGLDENDQWQDVLALLKRIVRESQGRVKLLISSRSLDTIRELISNDVKDNAAVIELTQGNMASDIEKYISWKLKDIDTRDLGGRDQVSEALVNGARGLVLLAKYRADILIRQTREGKTNLKNILNDLPEEVDAYYLQFTSRMRTLPEQDREVVVQIFIWAVFSMKPLTFQELSAALTFHQTRRITLDQPIVTHTSFDIFCQGLIVLRNDTVEVAHGSVLQFLLQDGFRRMTDLYAQDHTEFDTKIVHADIAGTLLDYFSYCPNPDLESGKTWSNADVGKHPLLDYAIKSWPFHTFLGRGIIPAAFEKFMQSPQRKHWWQCWSLIIGTSSLPFPSYSSLQRLFHVWVGSFHREEANKIKKIAGTHLPLHMLEEKLQLLESRPDANSEQIVSILSSMSLLYDESGQWKAALDVGEKALRLSPGLNQHNAPAHGVLAKIYGARGDRMREREMKERLLNFSRSQYGLLHTQTISALDNLALTYRRIGDYHRADELSLEAMQLAEDLFGEDHPKTLQVIANRSMILSGNKRLDEALPLAMTASEKLSLTLGDGHIVAIISKDNLALLHYSTGNDDEGRKLRLEAFTQALASLGHAHPTTKAICDALESEFEKKNDLRALWSLRQLRMEHLVEIYGEDDPRTLGMMGRLLVIGMAGEDWESAKAVGERLMRAIRPQKDDLDGGHAWQGVIQNMARVYDALGEHAHAIALGEEALSFFLRRGQLQNEFGFAAARDVSRMYHRAGDGPNAIRCARLAAGVATAIYGADSDTAMTMQRELAGVFRHAQQYQAGFDVDKAVYRTCLRVYGGTHATTVDALLAVCEAVRWGQQQAPVMHLYQLLLLTQKKCREKRGANHADRAAIQNGLERLLQRTPAEWHADMLALRASDTSDATGPPDAPEASLQAEPDDRRSDPAHPVQSASDEIFLVVANATVSHLDLQLPGSGTSEGDESVDDSGEHDDSDQQVER